MIDVCAIIERETGQKVTEDTPLSELELDSLEFMDLLLTLSNEAGITLSNASYAKLAQVADIRRELGQ